MKRKMIGILICVLMTSSVLASAGNVLPNNTDNNTISVDIQVGAYDIDNTNSGYQVSMDNFGQLLIPGKPNLPSKIFSIAIPPGAEIVDVDYSTTDTIISGVYNIIPSPLPRVIGEEDPVLYEKDLQRYNDNYNSVYTSNSPYPSSIVEINGNGGYRKYNLVDVRVNPITYYPQSGSLVYHSTISISIEYNIAQGFSTSDIINDNLPQTEKIAKEIILNYDQAQAWYPKGSPGRESFSFVLITTEALEPYVSSLVDWESAKGNGATVVTTSWISSNYEGFDLAAKMRAFLLESYPSGSWGIQNVCLVGSYSDVPMRTVAQNIGYGAPETDYYYAELSLPDSQSWDANGNHQYGENSDPIDFETEVAVGRIPWSDPTIVQNICEKSVAFEQNTDPAFKKNILLIGTFFWPDTDNAVLMEAKVDQDWMTDWTMTRMYEDAQSSYPCDYDANYQNVETVWSEGSYSFVDWAGHGSESAAYEYYPSQPFVDEQTCLSLNDNYPSIIFADSCSNSDTDYLNIGQAMLKQGGVGFLGSNKVAFGCPGWNNPNSGSSQSLDYYFTTCCTSGEYTQGQAHNYALRQMYVNNLWDYTRFEMFEWGSIWGNPDLTMSPVTTSDPPYTPSTPAGPDRGTYNKAYSFSSSTTEPDGEDIFYMFDWDDGTNSGWVGPYTSGQTVIQSHSWANIGDYELKVIAKDINGATSDWSELHPLSIVENQAPSAPVIDGPAAIKPGLSYLFKFNSTDDDGDDISYYVDWGNGATEWYGPYASGETATASHKWQQGTFTLKAKARDSIGDESDWTTLEIVVPRAISNYQFISLLTQLFEKFLSNHPNLFIFLQSLSNNK